MATIDERVVAMSFETTKFDAGVKQTMDGLTKLNASLANIGKINGLTNIEASANKVTLTQPMTAIGKLEAKLGGLHVGTAFSSMEQASQKVGLTGPMTALDKLQSKLGHVSAGTTFTDLEKSANRVSFESLNNAIDGVGNHLSLIGTAAAVALGGLATKAATVGGQLAKSLSLEPVTQGFQEYSTNLNSIQTILANTQFSGTKLDDVNAALQNLNTYSDQTIYNFGQMAKNIGTFTAAGVDLDASVSSIKGIANLAALSGSSSEQASTAMYQLSQAIAAGKVSLQDWNSVVNAGMGGATFQRALATTAEQMGAVEKGAVKIDKATGKATINGKSFRESITAKPGEQSWLTSDVLTKTLDQFTGDLTDAQLKAQGFTDAQIKSIQATAKTAKAAATEVKTLPQVFDVAKETIGSGWAQTFQTIFGNFEESKKTFTALSNTINGFINASANARNKVIGDWKALGGRAELLDGIKNLFTGILTILKPIKDAFRDIFPAKTGQQLFELTQKFAEFAKNLAITPDTADKLRRIFGGLFAVFHIGVVVIKEVIGFIGDLFGVAAHGSGGFLTFLASIGDFLKGIDTAVSKGGALKALFKGIAAVIKVPIDLIKQLAGAIFGLFNGIDQNDGKKFGDALGGIQGKLKPLVKLIEAVTSVFQGLGDAMASLRDFAAPILQDVGDIITKFVESIAEGVRNADFNSILDIFQTVFLGGLFLAIKKALTGGFKAQGSLGVDLGGGVLKNLSGTFKALTGNLEAMQKNIQAGTLVKIATAIGILAAAVFVLSTIDPKKLGHAMTAVAVGMGELVASLALLNKAAGGAAFVRMPFIAASLVLLSVAVLILAGAMKIFATMSWEDLAKGLVGVAGSITAVALATKLIGPQTVVAALALIPLAIGINILAAAVKIFAQLSWEDMSKGLLGVAAALLIVGGTLQAMPLTLTVIGPGLIAIALGLTILAGAVGAFAKLKPEELIIGLAGIAAALVTIGLAVALIPPTIGLTAAGLILMGIALGAIAGVVKAFGTMDIPTLVKGILAMGAALVVLGVGLTVMSGSIGGTVALLGAAAALAILVPVLALLGAMKFTTILKALGALALTLGVLAVVGGLAAIPLALLGAGLLGLGLGLAAVAVSVYIVAKGLALLGQTGAKGIAALIVAVTAFIAVFPKLVVSFIKGLLDIVQQVVDLAPKVLEALGKMLVSVVQFIVDNAPKLAVAIAALVKVIIDFLATQAGPLIAAGFQLLKDFLSGLLSNIGEVASAVAQIIGKFLDSLRSHSPSLAGSGAGVITAFLGGISSKIPELVKAVVDLVVKFIGAVASQISKITGAATNLMVKFIAGIISMVPKLIIAGTHVILDFLSGIAKAAGKLISKGVEVAGKFMSGIAKGLVKLVNVGFDAIIDFLHGIEKAIRERGPELRSAGYGVADALLDGMRDGIHELGHKIADELGELVRLLPKKVKQILGIASPSKVFMEIGRNVGQGFVIGIQDSGRSMNNSVEAAAEGMVAAASDEFAKLPNVLDGLIDVDPVITPVLDLTKVVEEAKKLDGMTNVVPITAAASFGQASAISAEKTSAETASTAQAQPSQSFNFEQNNYSPESLSEIEIYRQTNNQLAQLRSAVGLKA